MSDEAQDSLIDDESLADNLSPKRRRFVEEYILDLNGTAAAIRAGYSEKTAYQIAFELLRIPDVQEAIQEAKRKRARLSLIKADYVLNVIAETIERCRQVEPVLDRNGRQVMVSTPQGELVPAFTFDSKGTLKGAELLGKHLGILRDAKDVRFPDGVPVAQTSVTKEEFRDMLGGVVGAI
jgi:phage terminase small subunit